MATIALFSSVGHGGLHGLQNLSHTPFHILLVLTVARRVKPLPAMWETQVQSLGREDTLEKGMAVHSSILAENFMDRGPWWATVHGVTKSRT